MGENNNSHNAAQNDNNNDEHFRTFDLENKTANYANANDKKINKQKVRSIESKCNDHLRQFNKMFSVGAAYGQEDRIAHASTATNVPAPPLYGLRKTHKPVSDPPVRPVCGANSAPNSRLGHFLSRIINDFTNCAERDTECRSSEEMRAAFCAFNTVLVLSPRNRKYQSF